MTLPPPEWTAPATADSQGPKVVSPPLTRRDATRGRAEETSLRGAVHKARAAHDPDALRAASVGLARWLAAHDRDLDEAVTLAEEVFDPSDEELGRELSTWLENLGETGRAAKVLESVARARLDRADGAPTHRTETAYLFVRVGVLSARAGAAADAAHAFEEAMRLDPNDALADELYATLGAWAPEVVPAAEAARAYAEAVARREGSGGTPEAELEDALRAYAADPTSAAAATALAGRVSEEGADEVWRAHAVACAETFPQRAAQVHAKRRARAIEAGDMVRALGAALDEGLDRGFEGEPADALDNLLVQTGLLELLAARLEVRAAKGTGATRARQLAELARLYAGPLADAERATEAHVDVLAADPFCEGASDEALVGLRAPDLRRALADLRGVADEGARRAHIVAALQRIHASRPPATERLRFDARAPEDAVARLDEPQIGRAAACAAWVSASLLGDLRNEGRAMNVLAGSCAPALRSMLLAHAAGRLFAAGARADARRAAEQACQADPASAHAVAILADVIATGNDPRATPLGLTADDHMTVVALERAVGVVCARPHWCAALAEALEGIGRDDYAVAWTQRYVALRPGEHDGIALLVQRIARARDPSRLADTLGWVISQPQPLATIGALFAGALGELAMLDRQRAVVLARRALDVFGPRDPTVRATLLAVADDAEDYAFAAAVLERWRAAEGAAEGTTGGAAEVLRALAERCELLGDGHGEARALARLAQAGESGAKVEERLAVLADAQLGGDGEVWLLEARAALRSHDDDGRGGAEALRDLGAAHWDLADDREGAFRLWLRAARLGGPRGYPTLGADLSQFASREEVLDRLVVAMADPESDAELGALAVEAARAALALGQAGRAFDLAELGITRHPTAAGGLEIAERATMRCGRHEKLSLLYDAVAERALGRFGRRSAHYRGARFFEQHGEGALSLKHAARAFSAVPAEGATFLLLARAAERANDSAPAIKAVEQVAEEAANPTARASWLLRAASLAGSDDDGLRLRVDVLLRAAVVAPELGTLALFGDAARTLLRRVPEERDGLELRFERARRALTDRLDGPEGARLAIAFVELCLDLFGDVQGALAAVECALAADADLEEYEGLLRHAPVFAFGSDAHGVVRRLLERAERPYANVGLAALRLAGAIAGALGDASLVGRSAVYAAAACPEDDALVLEADAAVRTLGDPALANHLGTRVDVERRVEALRTWARARAEEGAFQDAASGLERAAELSTGELRDEVNRELRSAYDAAGRPQEVDNQVEAQGEAQVDEAGGSFRAARWTEVAERREQRQDPSGALRALQEAARLDPGPIERWSAIERVAELAGDAQARATALVEIVSRVGQDGRVAVFRRLARAYDACADSASAEQTWRQVLEIDPDDEEADQGIEAVVVAEGRYEDLADHLARRVDRLMGRSGARETLRALRLRRAAILEQRLNRVHDACGELTLLLAEWPDNASALRYLADLYERMDHFAKAAPLWRRAASLEHDPNACDELEIRAARASAAAGDLALANAHLRAVLTRHPTDHDALAVRVELARLAGDDRELGDALEALALAAIADPEARSDVFVEAAQAAWRHGDTAVALARAQHAAQTAPERAGGQFLARGLEYRLRGAGAPDEARRTLDELAKVRDDQLPPEERALKSFLMAEALDVVQGGAAGMRQLLASQAELGDYPLLAVGLAERLVSQGNHATAVPYFEFALEGDLLDLRAPGAVALAGVDAALHSGAFDRARRLLALAEQAPESQSGAALRAVRLEELQSGQAGGHVLVATDTRASAEELERARVMLSQGDVRGAEEQLWRALTDGAVEAGDELAKLLGGNPERARDVVRARRTQVGLVPGDPGYLQALRTAALASDDTAYARAVEHVMRAFEPGADPLDPPSLADLSEQPGILRILTKPSRHPVGEALGMVWDGAAPLFARDPASYAMTGKERIVPGPTSALGRLYERAVSLLDLPRIPLFVPRATGSRTVTVAPLSFPSVLITGDVREDTAALRYALGWGLAAALPPNVLVLGLPEDEALRLTSAVLGAFGPPEFGSSLDASSGKVAESLWQMLPARAQRRLREMLAAPSLPAHDEIVERARHCGRRVGLFLAGDFGVAAAAVLEDHGVDAEAAGSPGALRDLCAEISPLADLFRLAVSAEYAAARWG